VENRVLFICDDMLPPGVISSGTKSILNLHKKIGAGALHILTPTNRYTSSDWKTWVQNSEKGGDVSYHVIDSFLKRWEMPWKSATRVLYFFKAIQLHRRFRFSVIHLYSSSPFLIHLSGLIKKFTRTRVFHTLCTCHTDWQRKPVSGICVPDLVIVTTEKMKNMIPSAVPSVFLPIPIEDRFLETSAPLEDIPMKKPDAVTIGYVGLMSARKGADDFLAAARSWLEIPTVHVVFSTPADRKETVEDSPLKAVIAELEKDFPGRFFYLKRNLDVRRLFESLDIFVYPLRTMDGTLGTPSTLVEAMASGVAVVASDLPEIRSFIEDGVEGVLVPPASPSPLSERARTLISSPDARRRIGEAARSRVRAFGAGVVLNQYQVIYKTKSEEGPALNPGLRFDR